MKKLFFLFISMAVCTIVFSQTFVSGNISVNTTWNTAESPYIVTSTVTVDASITLTIDPTVEVKFDGGMSLFVHGTINATTATFTSNNLSPIPGIWNYLRFYSGSTSTLSGCSIEYGDNRDWSRESGCKGFARIKR